MGKYDVSVNEEFDGIGGGLGYPYANIRQKDEKAQDGKTIINPAGNFRFNDDTEDVEELMFVVLFSHTGRSHWEEGAETPDCKSVDGKYPLNQTKAYSATCDTCQMAAWVDRKPPKCSETLQICCVSYDEEADELIPFILQLKGTGLDPGKKLLRALIKKSDPENDIAIWHYPASGKCKYVSKNGWNYYVPEFAATYDILPDDLRAKIDDFREDIKDQWLDNVKPNALPAYSGAPELPRGPVVTGPAIGQIVDEPAAVVGTTNLSQGSPFSKKDVFSGE